MVQLQELTADVNELTSFPDLDGLRNLIYFSVDSNRLTELPALPAMLQTLSARQNMITSWSKSKLFEPAAVGLRTIDLSDNFLTEVATHPTQSVYEILNAAKKPSLDTV